MAALTREFLLVKTFSDPKNYPYGFSRSGDFSISESKALVQYGCLIAALVDGKLTPSVSEDENYLLSAMGKKSPETIQERAWLRYQSRINRPKYASIYGAKKAPSDESDSVDANNEIDDDINIEIDD